MGRAAYSLVVVLGNGDACDAGPVASAPANSCNDESWLRLGTRRPLCTVFDLRCRRRGSVRFEPGRAR